MHKFRLIRTFVLVLSLFMAFGAMAQSGTIKGKVFDKRSGETLPGANVFIDGRTFFGASTDINGNFTIQNVIPGKYSLICSFTGYKRQVKDVVISADQTLSITFEIEEDKMMLDEVVVVGYGTKRKRDITSSIAKVKSQEIENIPVTNFNAALQGKAPGIQVTQDNGLAGGGVTIRVRGTSSIYASSEPLYIVDGVPLFTGSFATGTGFPDKANILSQLNPNDIESIEILKDASAAAIYGARAANGVVLITTKKGKEGKTIFNLDYYAGFSDVTKKLGVLNSDQYLSLTQEAWLNSAADPNSPQFGKTMDDYWANLPFGITKNIAQNTNIDWIDQALRKGFMQSTNLSASGGSGKTTYFVSGAYLDEKGVLEGNSFKRFATKINLNQRVNDKFQFGTNVNIAKTINNRVPTGWAGGLGTAQSRSLPIMPIYDSLGNYFGAKTSGKANIVAERENLDYVAHGVSILGHVYGEYKLTPYLKLRSEVGTDAYYQRESKYEGTILYEDAISSDRRVQVESFNSNTTLSFDRTINSKHEVNALIGMSVYENRQYEVELTGTKFANPSLTNPNGGTIQTGSAYETAYGFVSYFARAGYTFNNKLLATVNVRRDGSSRFGPENRWGIFPAGSIGYILSEERFMKDISWLSFLKLRASYGITGNAEIGNFRYLGLYYTTKYNNEPGIGVSNLSNPELGWEKSSQIDVGLDFGLLEGRISGGFDVYVKKTSDMLLQVNVPQTSGSSSITRNVGKMDNKGVEFFLTTNNLVGRLKWSTDINLSRNKNEITDIEGQIISGENYGNNFAQEGHPIGAWRLVEYAGVNPENGKPLFINQETGEKTEEWNYDRDATVVGNPYPEIFGGVNNSLSYQGFDFSFLFTFALGHDVYRDDGKFFEGGKIGSNWNQMTTILDRWQKEGDVTDIPKLIWEDTYSTYNTTQYLDDASFLRLKNIVLGYTLPKKVADRMKIEKLRIYVMGTNMLTFTNYKGWDPEVNRDASGNITQGVTYLSPPQVKTFQIGLNLQF